MTEINFDCNTPLSYNSMAAQLQTMKSSDVIELMKSLENETLVLLFQEVETVYLETKNALVSLGCELSYIQRLNEKFKYSLRKVDVATDNIAHMLHIDAKECDLLSIVNAYANAFRTRDAILEVLITRNERIFHQFIHSRENSGTSALSQSEKLEMHHDAYSEFMVELPHVLMNFRPNTLKFTTFIRPYVIQPVRTVNRTNGQSIYDENMIVAMDRAAAKLTQNGIPVTAESLAREIGCGTKAILNAQKVRERSKAISIEASRDDDHPNNCLQISSGRSAYDILEEKERIRIIREALQKAMRRAGVAEMDYDDILHLLNEDYSVRKIANTLNMSYMQVRNLKDVARDMLFNDENLRELYNGSRVSPNAAAMASLEKALDNYRLPFVVTKEQIIAYTDSISEALLQEDSSTSGDEGFTIFIKDDGIMESELLDDSAQGSADALDVSCDVLPLNVFG